MGKYVVAVFSDLCKHSQAWNRIPKDQMAGLVGEYKALAEKVASQYGSFHTNFTGDGHLFLFDNADGAVRFALKLITVWRDGFGTIPALQGLPPIPLRVGAHFGEGMQIGDGEAWVGRVNNVASRIQGVAAPDTLLVSEGMLDLMDFPLYQVEPVAAPKMDGDCVARRTLYHVGRFDDAASAAKPRHELTAEEWFLTAVAMIGTAKENSDEQEACYVEALRLQPDYAKAHNNYAILLQGRGDLNGAEEHYMEALRLRPEGPRVHNNYALFLHARGDLKGAEEHYMEALRFRPDYAEAHNNYANLLKERDDLKGAEEHYVEALRLRSDYPEAHCNYAVLLKERGNVKCAEEHCRRAYELDPSDPHIKSEFETRAWER